MLTRNILLPETISIGNDEELARQQNRPSSNLLHDYISSCPFGCIIINNKN